MRCKACNEELTDKEAVRKNKIDKEFLDFCFVCVPEFEEEEKDDSPIHRV